MKKIYGLLFITVLVLAGCGASSGPAEQKTKDELSALVEWQPENQNDTFWDKKLTEVTGQEVSYDTLPADSGDALTKLQLELSTGADYQMVKMYPDQFAKFVTDNALSDIKPYLEAAGADIFKAIPQEFWDTVTDKETGAIYGIPYVGVSDVAITSLNVRKDILAKEGIAVPTTTDELKSAVCTLATKGYKTPYAKFGDSALDDWTIKGAFNLIYNWNDTDGNLAYTSEDPNFAKFLDFEKSLYDCGGFGKDYETITTDDAQQRFISGDTVFMSTNHWNEMGIAEGLEKVGVDYTKATELIVSLKGPDGKQTARQAGALIDAVLVVPKKQEAYAQQVVEFINKQLADIELQKLIAFKGDVYSDTNPDGTYFIKEDGSYTMLNPSANGKYVPLTTANQEDFKGTYFPWDVALRRQLMAAEKELAIKKGEAGEIKTPADANIFYRYTTEEAITKYGVEDPLALEVLLPKYSKIQTPIFTELKDYTSLYVTGKQQESLTDFSARMKSQFNLEDITKEVNDSVK
ncbi:MAG: extracellular solute-binding protein [Mycoplasmatales bacterium]